MDFSMFEVIENTANANHNNTYNYKQEQNNYSSERFPKNTPLAMAYVPCQQWGETYNIETGFCKGTIFPELDLPFAPEEGCI